MEDKNQHTQAPGVRTLERVALGVGGVDEEQMESILWIFFCGARALFCGVWVMEGILLHDNCPRPTLHRFVCPSNNSPITTSKNGMTLPHLNKYNL